MQRSAMFDKRVIVACLVVVAATGCGGGKRSTSEPTPSPTIEPTIVASWAHDAVTTGVIGAKDLPGGWVASPREPSGQLGLNQQCHELDGDGFAGQLAYAASDRLRGPQKDAMNSEASAFATGQAAQDAVDRIRDTLRTCRDEYVSAIVRRERKSFVDAGGDEKQLGDVTVTITEQPVATIGDSAFRLRYEFHVVVNGAPQDFATDLTTFRVGRMVARLGFDPGSGDGHIQDPVLELVAARLAKANATLGQR
jgi:hypothetical protein